MLDVGFAETEITPKLGSQSPGRMQARRLNEAEPNMPPCFWIRYGRGHALKSRTQL
jgi:hypothetical protein